MADNVTIRWRLTGPFDGKLVTIVREQSRPAAFALLDRVSLGDGDTFTVMERVGNEDGSIDVTLHAPEVSSSLMGRLIEKTWLWKVSEVADAA